MLRHDNALPRGKARGRALTIKLKHMRLSSAKAGYYLLTINMHALYGIRFISNVNNTKIWKITFTFNNKVDLRFQNIQKIV